MPLVKTTLASALEAAFLTDLKAEFKKTSTKQKLRQQLDGDSAAGSMSSAKTISAALGNIKIGTQIIASTPADQLVPSSAEAIIKKFTSNEWANAISDSICEWMSSTIAPIIAEKMAKTIADQVDIYIKSATIIIPPGSVVAAPPPAGAGTVVAPSPPALIT